MTIKQTIQSLFVVALLISGNSCKKNDTAVESAVAGPEQAVYGLTPNNEIVLLNANNPSSFLFKLAITGIPAGEKLMSIDCRPATGEIYAVSNASKLYIIAPGTSKARPVSTTAFSPAISGNIASIDFNPTVDRIRLVTNMGQNLRLNPETGVVSATDMNINGDGTPVVSGLAYTNSKAGAMQTDLYDIDLAAGKLYKQTPPNDGKLVEVGSLNITSSGQAAFDINSANSNALMALKNDRGSFFYKISLATGAASMIGLLPEEIIDIAIPTEPVAFAVDFNNNLYAFNPQNPFPLAKAITGLQGGETINAIDFRPVNGQLYALGSSNRLYTINLGTGAATMVGASTLSTSLTGTAFDIDFNPTVDRIRVISNNGQNLRLNPNDGTVAAVDGNLNPGSPQVSGAAYTNNFSGATTTTLYTIDPSTDKLYIQSPPNNGTLTEVGSLGIDIANVAGFDIGSASAKAYLLAGTATGMNFYEVNLNTGGAILLNSFSVGVKSFSLGTGF